MRAIGKLPKSVLILEFIGMMSLAVALLSVSDTLSLPEPFSRPEVQILMIFLGVLLMLPAAVVVILQVAKRLAPQLMNPFPKRSVRRLLTAPVRRQFWFLQCSSIIRITDKALREELVTLTGGQNT